MAVMLVEKKVASKVGMTDDWWVEESVEMWVDPMVVMMAEYYADTRVLSMVAMMVDLMGVLWAD